MSIILNLAVSLDSYIEGPKGEYDWCFTDQDYGMTEFLAQTDAIFMGRKSYETLQKSAPKAFLDKQRYVFSRTLSADSPGITVISENIAEEVQRIKVASEHNQWLFGGAELVKTFLDLELIDLMVLSIHPVLLGAGKPLFQSLTDRTSLRLVDTKTYSSGLVQLAYDFG